MLFPALHYFSKSSSVNFCCSSSLSSIFSQDSTADFPSVSTHLLDFFISFCETIYFNNKYIRYCSSYRLSQVIQRNGNVIYVSKLGYYKLLLY